MSNTLMMDNLFKMLIRHEGLRLKPYKCQAGKLTIGVGRNLEDFGINRTEALALLVNDIERIEIEARDNLKFYQYLNDARKCALLNMLFNLGLTRFLKFTNMIKAFQFGDYKKAAEEMLNSQWSVQVGKRAVELSQMIEFGKFFENPEPDDTIN